MYPEESTPLRRLPANIDERLHNERVWTEVAAQAGLDGEEHMEWLSLRSTHRFLAFKSKQLFIWRQVAGVPQIVRRLEVDDVELVPEEGFTAYLFDQDDREVVVSHIPERVEEGIYLWMPYYNDVQYVQRKDSNEFDTYFSMMCRMPRNPELRSEGPLHISERKALLALWPDLDLRKFL